MEICGILLAEDEDTSPEAVELRAEIMEEFEGTVFRDRVWQDPRESASHGKAKLRLKPGAVPVVGRTISSGSTS